METEPSMMDILKKRAKIFDLNQKIIQSRAKIEAYKDVLNYMNIPSNKIKLDQHFIAMLENSISVEEVKIKHYQKEITDA